MEDNKYSIINIIVDRQCNIVLFIVDMQWKRINIVLFIVDRQWKRINIVLFIVDRQWKRINIVLFIVDRQWTRISMRRWLRTNSLPREKVIYTNR